MLIAQEDITSRHPLIITDHLGCIVSRGLQHPCPPRWPRSLSPPGHRLPARGVSSGAVAWRAITWVMGILYTIPAIAFIFLLLPSPGSRLRHYVGQVPSIAYSLAEVDSVPEHARRFDGVDADVKEAAAGDGLFRRQNCDRDTAGAPATSLAWIATVSAIALLVTHRRIDVVAAGSGSSSR